MSDPLKHAYTEFLDKPSGMSSNPDASISDLTRHPDLWFNDGSIVLSVQTTLFRVHRSILSAHCTVFADMFNIPQPADQSSIEGCPIVHLPDSAQAFACLLKALYDPLYAMRPAACFLISYTENVTLATL